MTMLWYAMKTLGFKTLQLKFLENGHTQNENESVHAAIERSSRNISVYTIPQWAAAMRSARLNQPYQVHELSSTEFLDFKKFSQKIPNGQKIKWRDIKIAALMHYLYWQDIWVANKESQQLGPAGMLIVHVLQSVQKYNHCTLTPLHPKKSFDQFKF